MKVRFSLDDWLLLFTGSHNHHVIHSHVNNLWGSFSVSLCWKLVRGKCVVIVHKLDCIFFCHSF